MPRYTYECPVHKNFQVNTQRREKTAKCPGCGAESRAILKVGSSQIIERLDNGLMPRAVERLHNIEEIMAERDAMRPPEDDDGDTDAE